MANPCNETVMTSIKGKEKIIKTKTLELEDDDDILKIFNRTFSRWYLHNL